jgi:hypothetical protein
MIASRKAGSLQDAEVLLNCRRLPGRLNTTEAAVLLGFQEHDIPVLIAGKLLNPLGRPAPNSPKYFASVEIEALTRDRDWLSQATKALAKFWLSKNQRKGPSRFDSIVRAEEERQIA